MSDYTEMSSGFEQLQIDRHRAERILAETKAAVALATSALAAANHALLMLSRALGEPMGLRPVPDNPAEMAVWDAAEAEKR